MDKRRKLCFVDGELQVWLAYCVGLQISPCVDDEVPPEVLGGDVGHRCRELLREIARSREILFYAGSVNRDHMHMLIGIPPQQSVSKAVQYLKGKSSYRLLSEYGQYANATGAESMGTKIMSGDEWECDRRGAGGIHQEPAIAGVRR